MIRNLFFLFVLSVFSCYVHGQDMMLTRSNFISNLQINNSSRNYVTTILPLVPTSDINNLSDTEALNTIQYFDKLGRLTQTIQIGASPDGSDIVAMQGYDECGRPDKEWQPIAMPNNSGNFVGGFDSWAYDFHDDWDPYNRTFYEASHSGRVINQIGAGEEWHSLDKGITIDYLTNDQTEVLSVRYYSVDQYGRLVTKGKHPTGELYVKKITDEDGNQQYEFTDKIGRLILHRKRLDRENVDTYYVYDDLDRRRYVLSPLASDGTANNGTYNTNPGYTLDLYAYYYKYDHRGRCIEKKLPGARPIYYAYDKSDRLIYSQTGNQRDNNTWTVNKYDILGRLLYSSEYKAPAVTGNYVCELVKDLIVTEEFLSASGYNPNEMEDTGYSDNYTAFEFLRLLTVNYYDDYSFLDKLPADSRERLKLKSGYSNQYDNAKGLLTGKRVYLLNDPSRYIVTAYYYDDKKQIVQERSTNIMHGYDIQYHLYDFSGKLKKTLKEHFADNIDDPYDEYYISELYEYNYDHANRLTHTYHQDMAWQQRVLLSENEYDAIGRLSTKKRHNGEELSTYKYNIRNWPTQIRIGDFTQHIYYNSNPKNQNLCYNGNISACNWTYGGKTSGYLYKYDNLDRLKSALCYYGTNMASEIEDYEESFDYDKHGNILRLKRTSPPYGALDDLEMSYSGNRLLFIYDGSGNHNRYDLKEYKGSENEPGIFGYDNNGNRFMDTDCGIVATCYNLLNLPDTIQFENGNQIINTYGADGRKFRTDYITSKLPVVVPLLTVMQWDLRSDDIYRNTKLYLGDYHYNLSREEFQDVLIFDRSLTPEGYYRGGRDYEYYRKDYLGNNREIWSSRDKSIYQRIQYYPSGLQWFESYYPNRQNFKFGGKEFIQMHGYDRYDFVGRTYYSAVMSFDQMDPMAEDYYDISPYAYCMNNPVKYVDLDGLDPRNFKDWIKFGGNLWKAVNANVSVGLQFSLETQFGSTPIGFEANVGSVDLFGIKDGTIFTPMNSDKSEFRTGAEIGIGVFGGGTQETIKTEDGQKIYENKGYIGTALGEVEKTKTTPINDYYQKIGPTTSETNTRVPDIGYKAKFVVGAEASFDLNKAWEALKTLIFE